MFTTLKQKIILAIYIFILISIPIGSYLASSRQTYKSKAAEADHVIISSPDEEKEKSATKSAKKTTTPASTPSPSPTVAVSFGPTMNLKLILEGRPKDKYAGKVFIGIAEGTSFSSGGPKYLLQFTIDLPSSGFFEGLSLAGLSAGTTYSAYIKPTVQIATSSAFIMSPSITNLNSGAPLTILTGDLNEDNTINSADYSIAKAAFGAIPSSSNWNENIDFNKDQRINSFDLGLIVKNFGKTGLSGVWISPTPATKSGSIDKL